MSFLEQGRRMGHSLQIAGLWWLLSIGVCAGGGGWGGEGRFGVWLSSLMRTVRVRLPSGASRRVSLQDEDSWPVLGKRIEQCMVDAQQQRRDPKEVTVRLPLSKRACQLEDLLSWTSGSTVLTDHELQELGDGDWLTVECATISESDPATESNRKPVNTTGDRTAVAKRTRSHRKVMTMSDLVHERSQLLRIQRESSPTDSILLVSPQCTRVWQRLHRVGGMALLFGPPQSSHHGTDHRPKTKKDSTIVYFAAELSSSQSLSAQWEQWSRLSTLCGMRLLGVASAESPTVRKRTCWSNTAFRTLLEVQQQSQFLSPQGSVLSSQNVSESQRLILLGIGDEIPLVSSNTVRSYKRENATSTLRMEAFRCSSQALLLQRLDAFLWNESQTKASAKSFSESRKRGEPLSSTAGAVNEATKQLSLRQAVIVGGKEVFAIDSSLLSVPLPVRALALKENSLKSFPSAEGIPHVFPSQQELNELSIEPRKTQSRAHWKYVAKILKQVKSSSTGASMSTLLADALWRLRDMQLLSFLQRLLSDTAITELIALSNSNTDVKTTLSAATRSEIDLLLQSLPDST